MSRPYTINIADMEAFVTGIVERVSKCETAYTVGVEQGRFDMVSFMLPRKRAKEVQDLINKRLYEVL